MGRSRRWPSFRFYVELVLDKTTPLAYAVSAITLSDAPMVIIETPIFTRRVQQLLTDEEYRQLQNELIQQPDAGSVIQGSAGIRKLRWAVQGRGKRGGVRVIYYRAVAQDQILMLFIYPKNERDDLSPAQIKALKAIVEESYP